MSTDAAAAAVVVLRLPARVVVDDLVVVVERDVVVALVVAGAVVDVATTFTLPLHAMASAASARRAHLRCRTQSLLVVRWGWYRMSLRVNPAGLAADGAVTRRRH